MFVDVTKGSAFIFIAVMHPLINVSFMYGTHYIGLFTVGRKGEARAPQIFTPTKTSDFSIK